MASPRKPLAIQTPLRGRRVCIATAIASFLPVRASAQTRVFRVGVLDPDSANWAEPWAAFLTELARLGVVPGRNLVLERRFGDDVDAEGLRKNAAELVSLKVDLIYAAYGTATALAAKGATRDIPIVFYSSADPVGSGLVPSLARPAGNVTGSSIVAIETFTKSLQYLYEITGKLDRIVEFNPAGTKSLPWFAQMDAAIQAAARSLNTKFEYVEVSSIEELETAVRTLVREGMGAASVSGRAFLQQYQARIAALLISHRIPSIGDAEAGFLLELQPDWLALARSAARNVARILNGAMPADLPVEQSSLFTLVVNQRTANAIGLKIPHSMLLRADKVLQ